MKKIYSLLISFLSIATSAQVRLGATTGIQITDIDKSNLVTSGSTGNFNIGVMAEYRIKKSSFYIMGQALYGTMGYRKSNLQAVDKEGNQLGQIDLHRMQYIRVPLYFLYGASAGSVRINFGLGPNISFKTGDKLKIKGGDTFGNETALPLYTKRINSVLLGVGMHAGVQWSSVVFEFNVIQSLNGLYKNQAASMYKWRLTGFGFSLGYFFTKQK